MFFLPSKINMGHIKINTVGTGCRVSAGSTVQRNKNAVNKKTSGFGEQNGDEVAIYHHISIGDDEDLIDNNSTKV
ncbi:hypothetical protein [Ectobacillus panaciterrae]|uniref:hypothetical protein n=1 Tax=Ectobacillus panaciterrae TaxID=363872 RepID=UPI00041A3C01|nr:hypothetical protein [Ectobacillus panaciterrae]